MTLRSWSLCRFAVSVALFGAQAWAGDSIQQPTLGTPELIGVLAHFSFDAEVKVASLDIYEEPELGEPILLASLVEEEVNSAIRIAPADPQQIQEHLHQAARLLSAAGLAEQSQTVRIVLGEFRSQHADRLALYRKRAELARLQAEIERLSSQLIDDGKLLPVGYTEAQE